MKTKACKKTICLLLALAVFICLIPITTMPVQAAFYGNLIISGVDTALAGDDVIIYANFEAASSTTPGVSVGAVSMPINGAAAFDVYLGDAASATVTSGSEAIATATPNAD